MIPKALSDYWQDLAHTDWFKNHPILAVTCLFKRLRFTLGGGIHLEPMGQFPSVWSAGRRYRLGSNHTCSFLWGRVRGDEFLGHSWASLHYSCNRFLWKNPLTPVHWGKQKFELMSLICPASSKVATMDTRFLKLCCSDIAHGRGDEIHKSLKFDVLSMLNLTPTLSKDHSHQLYICQRGRSGFGDGVRELELKLPQFLDADIFPFQNTSMVNI